jgi:hypothetical protein
MTANLFGGAIKTADNPSSLVVKSMNHILILLFIYTVINLTDQVLGRIRASTYSNTAIHINGDHVPSRMAF